MEKTKQKRQISGGVYLVIDPSMKEELLILKLEQILKEKIAAVQIWDNFSSSEEEQVKLVDHISEICHEKDVPVFLNNKWKLLKKTKADGVHFDEIPEDFEYIRKNSKENALFGLTCNNDISVINQAEGHHLDYISFCSVFPSQTSNNCELVSFDAIKKARKITGMPIFLAGGIQHSNVTELKDLSFDGIAVVSGIMSAEDPGSATRNYINEIKKLKK
ncbi:thiamine phosphate synthase [Zunongwangia sp. F363]|uniref:Thiamine phosphate synthase n=1 Tax=Autumnicola tepida TaxID=3075595 RepID=A0ABU3C985_9FLAO|nr:thiamine phosphate synthase [Zunongwangia sp. F363]MDT0642655.1 thiamine phosphate synthase [Zunongwangia sp. F363]